MSGRVALCIDDASRIDPSCIGLSGENLESQSWLEVFPDGEEARSSIAQDEGIERVWVVSCDDVEPINLAATLKEDRPVRLGYEQGVQREHRRGSRYGHVRAQLQRDEG